MFLFDGLRQQLAVYQTYYNFCLPYSSLRQPLPQPVPTNRMGSAKQWLPCTPTMAVQNRTLGHGLNDLTGREHDVLRMMAQGYTNAGVARRLFLSERTVEAHVRRLLAKLDIADAEDAHRHVLAGLTYLRTA